MPWLRTDDAEAMAPWVFQVGNEAYGVFKRLEGYAAQQLTDGVVPAEMALMIAGSKKPLLALEIVGKIRRDENGRVTLPDFLDANPSRAQVEADREATRQRQAEWRAKRRANGRLNGHGHA